MAIDLLAALERRVLVVDGAMGTIIPDTMSARSMLSRWSKGEGVEYITFPFEGDLVVFFKTRLVDELRNNEDNQKAIGQGE